MLENYPNIELPLPNGMILRAAAIDDKNFPAINIYLDRNDSSEPEIICFAEYNPEQLKNHEVCICAYQSDKDESVYYSKYQK